MYMYDKSTSTLFQSATKIIQVYFHTKTTHSFPRQERYNIQNLNSTPLLCECYKKLFFPLEKDSEVQTDDISRDFEQQFDYVAFVDTKNQGTSLPEHYKNVSYYKKRKKVKPTLPYDRRKDLKVSASLTFGGKNSKMKKERGRNKKRSADIAVQGPSGDYVKERKRSRKYTITQEKNNRSPDKQKATNTINEKVDKVKSAQSFKEKFSCLCKYCRSRVCREARLRGNKDYCCSCTKTDDTRYDHVVQCKKGDCLAYSAHMDTPALEPTYQINVNRANMAYVEKSNNKNNNMYDGNLKPSLNINLETGSLKMLNADEIRKKIRELNKLPCEGGPCKQAIEKGIDYECNCLRRDSSRRSSNFHRRRGLQIGLGKLCRECGTKCPNKAKTCVCCKKVCKNTTECTCGCQRNKLETFEDLIFEGNESRRRRAQRKKDPRVYLPPELRPVCKCEAEYQKQLRKERKKKSKRHKKGAKNDKKEEFGDRMAEEQKIRDKRNKEMDKWRRKQIKEINKNMGKQQSNCLVDLIIGTIKCAVIIVCGFVIMIFKVIFRPKATLWLLKERLHDPGDTMYRIKNWFKQRWQLQKMKIQSTVVGSDALTILTDELKSTGMYQSLAVRTKSERGKKLMMEQNARRQRRMKERKAKAMSNCKDMLLTTLKKTPCLWFYYVSPNLYPKLLVLLKAFRDVKNMILFALAVCFWTPCILTFELIRGLFCCMVCTA